MKGNLIDEPIVVGSALRHGVADDDALHALRCAMVLWVLDEGVDMFVGADRSGRLLEVGVVERDGAQVIIHAMPARAKYLPRGR